MNGSELLEIYEILHSLSIEKKRIERLIKKCSKMIENYRIPYTISK